MSTLTSLVLTDVTDVFVIHSPAAQQTMIKNRATYGLSFCKSGRITYHQGERQYVSDRGSLVILPQGESYMLDRQEEGYFPLINFTCLAPFTREICLFSIRDAEPYYRDFEQLQRLRLSPDSRLGQMQLLYGILHRLEMEQRKCPLLAPAMQYMAAHYGDVGLSNALLAGRCNISEAYFRRLFTEAYQKTPHRYLLDMRLSRAKQLLCEGCLSISGIAEQCGFSSPYHFCRAFREQTGMTPTAYRNEHHRDRIS